MKRPKQIKEVDWIKFNIGVETIGLLSGLMSAVERQQEHSVKGMMRILDLKGDILKMHTREALSPIKLKIKVHGKEFVRECVYFAILFADMKLDTDILKQFGLKGKPQDIAKMLEVKESKKQLGDK